MSILKKDASLFDRSVTFALLSVALLAIGITILPIADILFSRLSGYPVLIVGEERDFLDRAASTWPVFVIVGAIVGALTYTRSGWIWICRIVGVVIITVGVLVFDAGIQFPPPLGFWTTFFTKVVPMTGVLVGVITLICARKIASPH